MSGIGDYWHKALRQIRRPFALPRASILQRRLSAVMEENQSLRLEVGHVRTELEDSRERQLQSLAELQQQVGHLEEERETAREQLETLQGSLTVAVSRQERTEQRVTALDIEWQKEREEQRADIREARLQVRKQLWRINASMLVAGIAFLLAFATTVTAIRDVRENTRVLAGVSRDLKDIKTSMPQQLAGKPHAPQEGDPALQPE